MRIDKLGKLVSLNLYLFSNFQSPICENFDRFFFYAYPRKTMEEFGLAYWLSKMEKKKIELIKYKTKNRIQDNDGKFD